MRLLYRRGFGVKEVKRCEFVVKVLSEEEEGIFVLF